MLPFDKFLPKKEKKKRKRVLVWRRRHILRIASTLGLYSTLHIITIYTLTGNSEEYHHIT
jgi:hypothetical protein